MTSGSAGGLFSKKRSRSHMQAGLVFNAKATQLLLSGLVLADNRIGLVSLPVCGKQGLEVQCSVDISDVWMIGASNMTDCQMGKDRQQSELCDLPLAEIASQADACSSRYSKFHDKNKPLSSASSLCLQGAFRRQDIAHCRSAQACLHISGG